MVGLFVGALVLGRLSDVLGRRITITLSILGAAIAQIAGGLSKSFGTYATARFLAGIGNVQALEFNYNIGSWLHNTI